MNKLILLMLFMFTTSQAATVWAPAGYWYKETTAKGAVRFSKMTDAQVKSLCTVTPPLIIVSGGVTVHKPLTCASVILLKRTEPFAVVSLYQ